MANVLEGKYVYLHVNKTAKPKPVNTASVFWQYNFELLSVRALHLDLDL